MLFQCWSNIYDAGPTLNQHWRNVQYLRGSPPAQQTPNICIKFIQCPPKEPGLRASALMELIDIAQVYMNLLWFENLLLMTLLVINAYLVLLWNRALAYPRALYHSGGPLSCEFWQLTIPLMGRWGGILLMAMHRISFYIEKYYDI